MVRHERLDGVELDLVAKYFTESAIKSKVPVKEEFNSQALVAANYPEFQPVSARDVQEMSTELEATARGRSPAQQAEEPISRRLRSWTATRRREERGRSEARVA